MLANIIIDIGLVCGIFALVLTSVYIWYGDKPAWMRDDDELDGTKDR
jgi:hypothetical protein